MAHWYKTVKHSIKADKQTADIAKLYKTKLIKYQYTVIAVHIVIYLEYHDILIY